MHYIGVCKTIQLFLKGRLKFYGGMKSMHRVTCGMTDYWIT